MTPTRSSDRVDDEELHGDVDLKLRDEGKLALDDPAERYVPELKSLRYPTTDSPRITIRQLLTHSEGFPEDNPWGDQQLSESESRSCRA